VRRRSVERRKGRGVKVKRWSVRKGERRWEDGRDGENDEYATISTNERYKHRYLE
jgi:hypothetical protein